LLAAVPYLPRGTLGDGVGWRPSPCVPPPIPLPLPMATPRLLFGLEAAGVVAGQPSTTRQVGVLDSPVSALGEDEAGNLYVVGYMPGAVYQMTNA
jgi:hypothetical protein